MSVLESVDLERVRNRFWKKVDVRGPDDCWEWKASVHRSGYGVFNFAGDNSWSGPIAHRVAYFLDTTDARNVPPSKGWHVLHSCHNRKCVNPAHLRIGTHIENMRDRQMEGNYDSPISGDAVVEIRERVAAGEPHADVAASFGVPTTTISTISRGDTRLECGGPLTKRVRVNGRWTPVRVMDRDATRDRLASLQTGTTR